MHWQSLRKSKLSLDQSIYYNKQSHLLHCCIVNGFLIHACERCMYNYTYWQHIPVCTDNIFLYIWSTCTTEEILTRVYMPCVFYLLWFCLIAWLHCDWRMFSTFSAFILNICAEDIDKVTKAAQQLQMCNIKSYTVYVHERTGFWL